MNQTGFWWIIAAVVVYGALHSLLASLTFKAWTQKLWGVVCFQRFYRLFFVVVVSITFMPVLVLTAFLPDAPVYKIPFPWVLLTLLLQGAAAIGLLVGVSQTGAGLFLGIRQVFDSRAGEHTPSLVIGGLYRWTRHPLYTLLLVLLWLMPVMTWNILAFNLAASLYMLVGSIPEEQKLLKEFGEVYRNYQRTTPRIIPGLHLLRRKSPAEKKSELKNL